MPNLSRTCPFFLFVLYIALNVQSSRGQVPPNAPIEVRSQFEPVVGTVGGRAVLVYELQITNSQSRNVTLNRVQVLGPDAASQPVALIEGDALVKAITRPGLSAPPADKRVITGGMRAIVYL